MRFVTRYLAVGVPPERFICGGCGYEYGEDQGATMIQTNTGRFVLCGDCKAALAETLGAGQDPEV